MKKTTSDILERIGFTKEESLVYKALLDMGPLSMSDIVRKTGLYRPVVYKVVPALIQKSLVSVMPKGKYKTYIAESPDRIERQFTELENDFNLEIFNMREMYEKSGSKPQITFTEGDDAIRNVYSDVVHSLKKNDTYYRYSPRVSLSKAKYIPSDYTEVRDKKNLERLIITDQASMKKMEKRLGKSMRAVPADSDLFDLEITEVIYGDKVAFVDYKSKTVVTIKSKTVAEFQKKTFKLLYKSL